MRHGEKKDARVDVCSKCMVIKLMWMYVYETVAYEPDHDHYSLAISDVAVAASAT